MKANRWTTPKSNSLNLLFLLASALMLWSCDDSNSAAADSVLQPDTGPALDSTAADMTPDTFLSDSPGPMANIYPVNPVEDNHQTSQVLLKHLTDKGGLLIGEHADIWNCVNEDGGEKIKLSLGGTDVTGTLCPRIHKASFKPGMGYLHITPPELDTDGSTSFSEVMAYHHITTIHDHFVDTFGLTHISKAPLQTIVNLQGYVDLLHTWIGLPNAMYIPADQTDLLKDLIGIDLLKGQEAMLFGYNNAVIGVPFTNYVFDATVIYHEYTHFAIGGDRLFNPAADKYGINPTPLALNEALADYFPSAFLGTPKMGSYALGGSARDISHTYKCPDHLVGESHNDGEIASSALWALRQSVGGEILDQAIWDAVLTFNTSTTFHEAALTILDEVKAVAPEKEAAAKALLLDQGMIDCVRLVPHQDFEIAATDLTQIAPGYAGKDTAPLVFTEGIPAYVQYKVALLPTTKEVTIEYLPQEGMLMGMGGTKGNVSVALHQGSDPITYEYTSGKAVSTAHVTLKGTDLGESGYKLVIAGSCIKEGDVVMQLINHGTGAGQIMKIKVTQSDTVTLSQPNFETCL